MSACCAFHRPDRPRCRGRTRCISSVGSWGFPGGDSLCSGFVCEVLESRERLQGDAVSNSDGKVSVLVLAGYCFEIKIIPIWKECAAANKKKNRGFNPVGLAGRQDPGGVHGSISKGRMILVLVSVKREGLIHLPRAIFDLTLVSKARRPRTPLTGCVAFWLFGLETDPTSSCSCSDSSRKRCIPRE